MKLANVIRRHPMGTRLAALALAGTVASVGVWVTLPRDADPAPIPSAEALAPPHVPIAVTARLAGTPPVAGVATTVTAHALGATPLAAIELWVGEELIATHRAERATLALYTTAEWVPSAAGEAVLFARAVDAAGRVAQSAVARHAVGVAPLGVGVAGTRAVSDGIVLAARAERPTFPLGPPSVTVVVDGCMAEVSVDTTSAQAAGITLLHLPPVAGAFVPIASLPAPAAPTTYPVPITAGSQLVTTAAYDETAIAYSDPVLVEGSEDCASQGWSGDARLVAGSLVVDPPADADVGYLYLTTDAGAAVRVPSEPGSFLPRTAAGRFDASAHLPPLAALESLQVEAWGWNDGELVQLGSGSWQAPAPPGGAPPGSTFQAGGAIAPPSATTLAIKRTVLGAATAEPDVITDDQWAKDACLGAEVQCGYRLIGLDEIQRLPNGAYASTDRTFHWTTQLTGVTSVHWQILPYAPPPSANLMPPFLIGAGTEPVAAGTAEGEFVIDFAAYLPQPEGEETTEISYEEKSAGAGAALELALEPPGATPGPMPANPFLGADDLVIPGGLSIGELQAGTGGFELQFGDETLYVRLIPMQGAMPALPSASVRIDIVDHVPADVTITGPATAPNLPVPELTWTFKVPMAMDVGYVRCAVIAELTDAFKPQQGNSALWGLYDYYKQEAADPNHKLCYSPPSDDGWSPLDAFEAFVEFVADVVDYVSAAYDSIKAEIVAALASSCDVIPGVSPSDCEPLAEAALTIVLASAGIPPSIPNFSEVVAGLKGDLAGAIVGLGGQLGFGDVCTAAELASAAGTPTCQELALAAIDELVAQVEAQQSKAAAKAAGLLPYPGVVFAPHPLGTWNPPTFVITIENPGSEPTRVCKLTADLTSTAEHSWKEPGTDGLEEVSGTVSGDPFEAVSFTLPSLGPGESMTREIALTEQVAWYPNVEAENVAKMASGGGAGIGQTWALLAPGASLVAQLRNSYADSYMGYHSCVTGYQDTKGPYVLEVKGNQ